jgi:hypothetical protein
MLTYATQGERRAAMPNKGRDAWDEVNIVTVPRYKTSYASGDEWRTSLAVCYYSKGDLLYRYDNWDPCDERSLQQIFRTESGHAAVPYEMPGQADVCDQLGCVDTATTTYRLRREYLSRIDGNCLMRGESNVDPYETDKRPLVRKFCAAHSTRGDCGLDDCDKNYELLSGAGPTPVAEEARAPSASCYVYANGDDSDSWSM